MFAGLVAALFAVPAAAAESAENLPPLQTVDHVDLERYMGTWYEIARFPHRFQEGCTATTAHYTLRDDGEVDVLNRCNKGGLDGPLDEAAGRARVADPETNAKLEVSFFGPFTGDYWILELGENYEYAVVGEPRREHLWILSRERTMPEAQYEELVRRAAEQGYDVSKLERTLQPPE